MAVISTYLGHLPIFPFIFTKTQTPPTQKHTTWYPPFILGGWSVRIDLCRAIIRPPCMYIQQSGRASTTVLFDRDGCSCCGGWGTSNYAAIFFMFPPPYILHLIKYTYSSPSRIRRDKHQRQFIWRRSIVYFCSWVILQWCFTITHLPPWN